MAVIETWLRQDLKGLVTVRSLQGQVFSLDNGGNLIGVKVTKDYKPVTLTGTVTGYCILSDGQTVTVTGSGNAGIQNGNEAYIVLPQLVYSVPGQISIVIKLTSGNTTTTLAACTGYVYRSRTSNEVVPPGTPIPDLATMEEVIRRATAATDAANAATVGAEKVDASMTKEGDVITITVTDRDGNVTEKTVTDQTEAMKRKADIDGYYEELAAGTADQLVSTEAVTDTTPYLYRKSGGSVDIGNRETLEKIVGGTVCWNQLYPAHTKAGRTIAGLTVTFENGWMNVSGTVEETGGTSFSPTALTVPKGHIALTIADKKGIDPRWGRVGYSNYVARDYQFKRDNNQDYIGAVNVYFDQDITYEGSIRFATYDLTAMFGPTIADYIYNLEQTTAGAGVAWFRKLFPKDYYSYNPGELISVKPSSHDMVGFNLFDKTTVVHGHVLTNNKDVSYASQNWAHSDYIPVIPNTTYYYSLPWYTGTYMVHYYNADKMFIGNESVSGSTPLYTMPFNAAFVRLNMHEEDVDTVSFNLSHSVTRNGEYEPYEKHSYPLADVELRGPIAIDADGKLVYSGDEYTPDGNVKRNYIRLNLGDYNYRVQSNKLAYTTEISSLLKKHPNFNVANIIMVGYDTISRNDAGYGETVSKKGCGVDNNGYFFIADPNMTWTTAEQVKAALTGMVLIAELATPTFEQVAPYNPVQVVDDWGTEEFVDTREVAIPVGHSTSYMANLRDKLQHLPSLADEDGEYIVKQTGTKMELAKLSSSGLAQGIFVETESAPVVSFADGADGQAMKAVNVAIEPVQDLHGYEYPWPAGGGTNLADTREIDVTIAGCHITSDSEGVMSISGTRDDTTGWKVIKTFQTFAPGNYVFSANNNHVACLLNYTQKGSTFTVAEGDQVKIALYNMPAGTEINETGIKVIIAKGNTVPEVWTPYSNVCPISGWTGAKVTRTGKNLLDLSILRQGSLDDPANQSNVSFDEFLPIKGGLQYVWSTTLSNIGGRYTRFYDATKTEISTSRTAMYGTGAKTFTAPENACYFRAAWYMVGGLRPADITKDQIELGSTATAYEPYQGQTYEVTFPAEAGTVYGGTLDAVAGKLTVDRAMAQIRAAQNKNVDANNNYFWYSTSTISGIPVIKELNAKLISNRMTKETNVTIASPDGRISFYGNGILRWKEQGTLTLSEYNSYLSENPLEICYEIKTPITYTLTPQEIKTLLGTNNIWSDAGNTSITYPADTKLYIDRKITEAVANALNA